MKGRFVWKLADAEGHQSYGSRCVIAVSPAPGAFEARRRRTYPLAQTALYLALAPKSNSVGSSYGRALAHVEATRNDPVPLHLRNAVTGLMRGMGYGAGYKYAHDFEGGIAPDQTYLPERLAGHKYYAPRGIGWEKDRNPEGDGR